jgi:hypothetical protein
MSMDKSWPVYERRRRVGGGKVRRPPGQKPAKTENVDLPELAYNEVAAVFESVIDL